MMDPVLAQAAGTGGPPYDDTELRTRIGDAEGDIETLKSGKATTASVTAVSNRVKAIEDLPTGQITVLHPEGGHASIGAACLAARNTRRWSSGLLPIVSVAPGTYAENPDITGCRVVSRSFPDEIVPTSFLYVANTARNYRVRFMLASSAGFAVGDVVHVRNLTVQNDDHARMNGDVVVTEVGVGSVTVKFSGSSSVAAVSADQIRLYRYPLQLRVSQLVEIDYLGAGVSGIGIAPQSSPEDFASHELLYAKAGAVIRLPASVLSTTIIRPGLGACNGNTGIRLDKGSSIQGGRISAGGCRYENIVLSNRSSLDVQSVFSTHGETCLSLQDNCDVSAFQYREGQIDSVISGGTVYGMYTVRGTRTSFGHATFRGSALDVAAYVNAFSSFYGAFVGQTTPAYGTTGNRNSFVGQ